MLAWGPPPVFETTKAATTHSLEILLSPVVRPTTLGNDTGVQEKAILFL